MAPGPAPSPIPASFAFLTTYWPIWLLFTVIGFLYLTNPNSSSSDRRQRGSEAKRSRTPIPEVPDVKYNCEEEEETWPGKRRRFNVDVQEYEPIDDCK